jgi:hypothetical protein
MTSVGRSGPVKAGVWLGAAICATFGLVTQRGLAQTQRTCEEIEAFMRTATLTVIKAPSALMNDGRTQHRVFVHTSDESRAQFPDRDTWKANVAAYELARMLQINIMPPYVETTVNGTPGSVSWGLDNVMMDDVQRSQQKLEAPDLDMWERQRHVVQVFDELLYDGRAPSDLLITKDWRLWIIGPSQAFRPIKTLRNPGNLVKCDRKLLAKMRTLDRDALKARLGKWLLEDEIDALDARARAIVQIFDKQIAARGDAAVLFDLDRSGPVCAL